jgi:hypothetical protein
MVTPLNPHKASRTHSFSENLLFEAKGNSNANSKKAPLVRKATIASGLKKLGINDFATQ